jgi:hypothetical protein
MAETGDGAELWAVLAAALGSALLGAIAGSAATFLGQKYLADQGWKRRRVGIVTALVSELMQNGAAVTSVLYQGGTAVEYSTEVWRAARFELAQFLRGELYEDVDFLYLTLPAAQLLASPPVNAEVRGLLEKWLEQLKATLRVLRQLPEYTRTDRDRLDELIEEAESHMTRASHAPKS